jgi:hypothetical protein
MRNPARLLAAAILAVGIGVAVQPVPSQAAPTSPTGVAQSSHATQVVPARWVPWDGNHITSYQNCIRRMEYLRVNYGIPRAGIKCQRFAEGLPPCPQYYWMVMVDADLAVAREVRAAALTRPVALSACR